MRGSLEAGTGVRFRLGLTMTSRSKEPTLGFPGLTRAGMQVRNHTQRMLEE